MIKKHKRRSSFWIINILIYSAIIYFIYHSLTGDRGVFAYKRLKKELSDSQIELDTLTLEKSSLETKISRMNKKNIDIDFVDELSREKLGLVKEGERIYIFNQQD